MNTLFKCSNCGSFDKNKELYIDYAKRNFDRENKWRSLRFNDLSPSEQEKEIKNFEYDMRLRDINLEEIKEKQDTLDKKLDKISSKKYDQLKNELLDIAWNTMSENDKNKLLDDVGGDSDGWFLEEGEGTWGFDSYNKSFQDVKDRFYEDASSRYVEDFVDKLEITSGLYDLFDFEEQKANMVNEYKFSKNKLKEKEKEYKKAQRVYNSLQKKGGSYAEAGKNLLNKSEWDLQKTKNEYEQNIKRLDAIKKLDKKYKTLTRKLSAIEDD